VLELGVLADTSRKQQALIQLIAQSGHKVKKHFLLAELDDALHDKTFMKFVDAWIVDIAADEHNHEQVIEELFDESPVPIILNESDRFELNTEAHNAWSRRLTRRIQRLPGEINLQQVQPAKELWILAASTGGPAAVKRFLTVLPSNLGMAFLYVQHIDAHQAATLTRMMTHAGKYPAMVATQGLVLEANSFTLVTARDSVEVLANGTLMVGFNQGWKGDYAPSIDHLAMNVAHVYREQTGIIVFTGMGDDGAASCKLIHQFGGKIWAQTPQDCVSDSMPNSALATGCVSLSGTPEYLAKALSEIRR
jgi:chemosensory pili system protein ChpB (putative protein-glutamate methylesterase)